MGLSAWGRSARPQVEALRSHAGHGPILHTVGNSLDVGSARQPIHKTETQNQRKQTSKPLVGFKPTTPVFERTKTVHALDRVTTLIGAVMESTVYNYFTSRCYISLMINVFPQLFISLPSTLMSHLRD
jgi:hypothetical protein